MQSDASIIESAAMQVHTIWDGPLQIGMYTYLLFKYLGPSVLWGLAVLLTIIPLNSITLRVLDRLARSENEAKSARTKRTNESITHMKLLKLNAWERIFAADVDGHRRDELYRHKSRGVVRAINSAVSNAVPALVLVVTLAAYAKTGKPIVASTIFTAISLFNQLRFPLFFYPMLIDSLANGKNAMRRISSYLTSEELTQYVQYLPPTEDGGGMIEMKHGSFLWSTSQEPKDGEVAPPEAPALCDVNLVVNPGEVVAVVGPVGSGKSALVKGLLGELAPVPKIVVDGKTGAIFDSTDAEQLMIKPSVIMHGNIAYASQEAWLPKGTLQDAVVFGRDYDDSRYQQALYDAGLDQDISNGTLNSEMDVGEKGSNLSGGQRARVALARALYSAEDTKVFLLDDCLAALDARVGALVFERVTKRLKASKAATILVTNDPNLPRRCDRVVLMGPTGSTQKRPNSSSTCSTIIDSGTYDKLLDRGHKLQSISSIDKSHDGESVPNSGDYKDSLRESDPMIESREVTPGSIRVVGGYKVMTNDTDCSCHADPEVSQIDVQNNPDFIADRVIPQNQNNGAEDFFVENTDMASNSTVSPPASNASAKAVGLISTDDKMTTQAVPLSIYLGYLKAVGSPTLIIGMLASFVVANGAQFFQQFTVSKWTEVARSSSMSAALGGQYLQNLVYAAGVVSVFLWLRSYFTMLVGLRASAYYHNKMLSSVFRSPMSFFDATPSGQILSRFGKELETVDRALPESIASVLFCVLQIMSSVLALSGAITPAMMVPLAFAGSQYVRIMRKFRPAARDMKRSEQRTRSPIFTNFGEALRGTEVIRSIPGAKQTWSAKHRRLADANLSAFATVKALDRWLSISLEAIGNSMVLITGVASVYLTRAGKLQSGAAGWGLTQSLAITGLMAWAVRNLTMLESHMMSVMRVTELTDIAAEEADKKGSTVKAELEHDQSRMPKEMEKAGEPLRADFPQSLQSVSVAPLDDKALVADGWPWQGGVSFTNVSMRYNAVSPLVLKGVTVSVPPGSTLGVVGRTGSGKSSLLLLLFRIVEIESGGSIEIDGVDIRSVSLETLRDSLAIIPQDPVLFAGTLAFNLDATGKASPEEMWTALEAASPDLVKMFSATGGLASQISEGGGNLSQGQRQLICLARALLKKSKILVLDEATSSVDAQTDQQVQDTIRRLFVDKGVSVITVAHRLDTVLGYDKIAVLGEGELLEYGTPNDLLQIRNGELRNLVDADRVNKRKGGKPAVEAEAVGV
jgi:ABC-type multidrug transport system fused ATPase/permease subunit